jgi:hypothetical protein
VNATSKFLFGGEQLKQRRFVIIDLLAPGLLSLFEARCPIIRRTYACLKQSSALGGNLPARDFSLFP